MFATAEIVMSDDLICSSVLCEFSPKEGCFTVPVKAVLPKYNVQVAESVNFCLCAVDDEVQTQIEVCNRR